MELYPEKILEIKFRDRDLSLDAYDYLGALSDFQGAEVTIFDGIEGKGKFIYFLFFRGVVQYIGLSKNILNRTGQHYKTKNRIMGEFDEIGFFKCPKGIDQERAEIALIKIFKPKKNRKHRYGRPTDEDIKIATKILNGGREINE